MNKIKENLDDNLSQKVIRSGIWILTGRIFTKGISFLKMIVVAQILGPGDFGLVAIALLTLSIFEVFTKAGFQESLIQKQGDIKLILTRYGQSFC